MHGASTLHHRRTLVLNEKGSVAAVESFPTRPEGFFEAASGLLVCPGHDASALAETLYRYETLLDEVHRSYIPDRDPYLAAIS